MSFSKDVLSKFPYEEPSDELLEAIAEVEEMKKNPDKYKGYSDVYEMMRDILL
ncbi:MAG: hypothetical protein K2J77_12020 [Oscillospiraceae bacterium]|nr:hypothetical protein [Oscillospiraceae bacterium]